MASYQSGKSSSGAHLLKGFWLDAMGGKFRCTAAGTPETGIQTTIWLLARS
jgi:hypothetical protein